MKHFPIKPFVTACVITVACAGTAVYAGSADGDSSDMWNKAAITTTITLNRHLNPFDIKTEVKDGVATLSGTVESDVDRDLAEELARGVEGIRDVKNKLKVSSDAGEKRASKSSKKNSKGAAERDFMRKVEDANLTAKVKSQLLWNSNTAGLAIDVDTHNGVVTLSGTVDSAAEADLAKQIARNTNDVLEVENNLKTSDKEAGIVDKVKQKSHAAGQKVSDGWITAKVKSVLMYSRNVDGTDINVDTKNGVVTLSGQVDSDFERKQAQMIASVINGVKDVNFELKGG